MGVGDTQAVGADDADAVFTGNGGQLFFPFGPFRPHLLETAGHHDGVANAFFPAGLQRVAHDSGGQHDHGQVRGFGRDSTLS